MIALTSTMISFLLVGFILLVMTWLGYVRYKTWIHPRIRCEFIAADRKKRVAMIKPNAQGLLAYQDGLYMYSSELIIYSGMLFGLESVPSLTFHQDFPAPVDIWGLKPAKSITSQMLGNAWNDKALKDFVSAQDSPGIKPATAKVGIVVILGAAAVGAYLLFGTSFFAELGASGG